MRKQAGSSWWQARGADIGVSAVIVGAFLAAFGWAIFRGKFLIGGDVFFYTYPMRTLSWRMIRDGILPVWTPNVLSGYPLLAMVQLAFGYPLTWFHLLLPAHWAEEIYVLAPFVLAPAFTYFYARELGRTRLAALLAGLAFGYGGLTTNSLGMNGLLTNSTVWLPLLLIALERSRRRFILPLAGATAAYALSVLNGLAQGFLMVGLLGGAYALFLVIWPRASTEGETNYQSFFSPSRWRPLAVVVLAYIFAFGIAAFQILETLRASRRSIRHAISYDFFSQGSLSAREAVLSFLVPLFHYIDATTYLAPIAAGLVVWAIIYFARRRQSSDPRFWFWLVIAFVAFIWMLGEHTPLYRIAYDIPIINWFRIPSRHTFDWSFALSILGAYGWDIFVSRERVGSALNAGRPALRSNQTLIISWLMFTCAFVGILWFLSVNRFALFGILPVTTSGVAYLIWKTIFTLCIFLIVWFARRVSLAKRRDALLMIILLLGCMTEPLILISQWWPGTAKAGSRLTTPGKATRYLQQFPPEQNRVFTHANLGVDENSDTPRVDVLNQPAVFGIQNAGGYEQLLFERYSTALGNVDYDAVRPRAGYASSRELFQSNSRVLDLLNVTRVVAFRDLMTPQVIDHEGFKFALEDLSPQLKSGTATFPTEATGDTLVLVTSLSNSVGVAQDTEVAQVRIQTSDGRVLTRSLRAGSDTSEWAWERSDVRAMIKHGRAPVFDSQPGDASNTYSSLRYWARVPLGERTKINSIEIRSSFDLAIWKLTVYDSQTRQSFPVSAPPLDPKRWQPEADFDGVVVLRNNRALPRAWLVTEVKTADADEALKAIRGVDNRSFDPMRTALVEAAPGAVPTPGGGILPEGTGVRLTAYEPARVVIETNTTQPSFLVTSEIFYPGWEATIDGNRVPILLTNYLLRGVSLPAGNHRVEMHYRSPAARNGAIISLGTLLLMSGLLMIGSREQLRARKSGLVL